MLRHGLMVGIALTVTPALLLAADPQLEAARQCTQMKDSLQRLVCYDKALAESPPAMAAAATVAVPAAAASAAHPSQPPVRSAPAAPAAVAAAPVVAAAAAPAVPAAAPAMGDESLKQSRKEPSASAEPSTLEAQVTAAREIRQDTYRVSLDNGQVWQQMDMSTLFQVKVGDSVRIEKGAMGGYRMARTSNGRSGWVRVARVQ